MKTSHFRKCRKYEKVLEIHYTVSKSMLESLKIIEKLGNIAQILKYYKFKHCLIKCETFAGLGQQAYLVNAVIVRLLTPCDESVQLRNLMSTAWTSSDAKIRRQEIVLTRLLIGYTLITHCHFVFYLLPSYATPLIVKNPSPSITCSLAPI